MGRVVVVGASGHAKVVIDAIERQGEHTVVGLFDDAKPQGGTWYGYPLLGPLAEMTRHVERIDAFFVAVGDGTVRERLVRDIRRAHAGLELATVVHPSAVLARGVVLGAGTIVMAGAILQADARVGEGCIVNTGASVDHDGTVGDFAALSPGATLGGDVEVGRQAFLGVSAAVLHGRKIGEHSVIGAGAVVTADVPSCVLAVGVPARVLRARSPGERYL